MTYKKTRQKPGQFCAQQQRQCCANICGLPPFRYFFAVGASVDYSRYSRGVTNLTSAGDIAIFAASKKMSGSGENNDDALQLELEDEFDKFMVANFDKDEYSMEFTRTLTFDRDAQTVSVEVEGTQKTAFLQVTNVFGMFGTDQLTFKTTLGTRLETTPENYVMDIIMCIDATGSMQNTLNSVQANAATFNTQLRSELNIDQTDPRFKVRVRPIYFRDWQDQQYYGQWGYYWTYYPTHSWWHRWHRVWRQNTAAGISIAPDFYDLDDAGDTAAFQAFLNTETASGGGDAPEAAGACLNEGMRSDWYDRDETTDFSGRRKRHCISDHCNLDRQFNPVAQSDPAVHITNPAHQL